MTPPGYAFVDVGRARIIAGIPTVVPSVMPVAGDLDPAVGEQAGLHRDDSGVVRAVDDLDAVAALGQREQRRDRDGQHVLALGGGEDDVDRRPVEPGGGRSGRSARR